jgi:hypothetical protein
VEKEWDRLKAGFIETAGYVAEKIGEEGTREHSGGNRE